MKIRTVLLTLTLIATTWVANAQSESYQAFKYKFQGDEDVFSFETGGLLARAVLLFSGDHEFRKAIRDVRHIRIMTVPGSAFEKNNVSLQGFQHVLKNDGFEKLMSVRDNGDNVSIYLQSGERNRDSRYFVLVDQKYEVVAIELHGNIDLNMLRDHDQQSYSK